jgi:PKHD-type hydroxylase
LAAGDLLVYSSTMRHRVNAVTRGERLASVFWVQSLVRDDAQRAQLFELDGTIQRLTATCADSDSLIRLTAHYHGLLKGWTEI